jgi:hypothetical protein
VFLGLLLVPVFILTPLADREGMLFASAGFSVLLISGVLLVAKNRMTRGLVTVTALITLIIHLDPACRAGDRPRVDERALVHWIPRFISRSRFSGGVEERTDYAAPGPRSGRRLSASSD